MNLIRLLFLTTLMSSPIASGAEPETLPPLNGAPAPSNFDEMWAGFDPRAEPLEVETLKEWEEDGVALRIVRFRIGVFKGQKATLAAVYGFPTSAKESGEELPGLVQIHGGGQYADHKACLMNAKRGYATVSIAWAGRISAPGYRVSPAEVQLFWDGKTDDPNYRVTTDWGAVDGYHAPGRNAGNHFPSAKPAAWTLDEVESPRNSGWFLCAMAARRALTFLERQPEVDANRLGVYGHSMGGKLTVMTAFDPRVKAAAPSCGGISDRDNDSELFRSTLGDDVSLKQVKCPIVFLSPANDFHGRIGDLPRSVDEIRSSEWRVTCSPHHNHQDTSNYEVATLLWFDQHLKEIFEFPRSPQSTVRLKTDDGIPAFSVRPDQSKRILSVDVYYTQQGKADETSRDLEDVKHRYWHHAQATQSEDVWTAKLPLESTDKPLWVYANVRYPLEEPVNGAGYYYGIYSTESFNVSSLLKQVSPGELQSAGGHATLKPSRLIEDFADDWEKEWFTYRPAEWARTTHKLNSDLWQAPKNAILSLEALAEERNKLVVLLDDYAAEVELTGGGDWQELRLIPRDFRNASGDPLEDWDSVRRLKLSPAEHLRPARGSNAKPRLVGANWRGAAPSFRYLRWHVPDQAADAAPAVPVLDVFPRSVVEVPADRQGNTVVSSDYTSSGSVWDERLDESQVFQFQIDHRQTVASSFKLRIGKGGQIYSLRGAFGESVPPSWRDAHNDTSPWNDEVWQYVAVCSKYNGVRASLKAGELPEATIQKMKDSPYRDTFFIHNSGAYIPGESAIDSLYCPLLASDVRHGGRCIRMVNWGLVPQVKSVHRSPLLYYTQVRDVGEGVVELTWIVHNFSIRDDIVFDFHNAPWGGTRMTSLPVHYVSSPEGCPLPRESLFASQYDGAIDIQKTGGWNLASVSEADDSPALAVIFGRDRHLSAELTNAAEGKPHVQFASSVLRDYRAHLPLYDAKNGRWKDWRTRPENSFRNYDVLEFIPRLRLTPGTSVWYRSFVVVNRKDRACQLARSLVNFVDYGLAEFSSETSPAVPVFVQHKSVLLNRPNDSATAAFELFAHPVPGTVPVFLIQNAETGREVITTDPYVFVPRERVEFGFPESHPHYDYYASAWGYSLDRNRSNWKSLLGFAHLEKPESSQWNQLSSLLTPEMFPTPDAHHRDIWVRKKTDT